MFASAGHARVVAAEGILGQYDPAEAATLKENIIRERTNLFGDMIPLYQSDRQWRRAEQDARALRGNLPEYYALYYIFPEKGATILMTGLLMPAGEELETLHLASMHFRPDEKTLERIKGLPSSTIVYGTDRSGNKAWWPLKFFAEDGQLSGYFSAEGLYAYTYRPSVKLTGRYGNTAYYIDVLDPAILEGARVIPEDNITVVTENLADEVVKAALLSRPVLYNRLIPMLEIYPRYGGMPYEIAIIDSPGKKGSIGLRLPAGIHYKREGDTIRIAPAPDIFAALEEYRAYLIYELYSGRKTAEAAKLLGFELSVNHYNDAGEIEILKIPSGQGLLMQYSPEVRVRPYGEDTFLQVREFDEENPQEGAYVFVKDESDTRSIDIFGLLEAHTSLNGIESWPPFVPREPNDWTTTYDTVKYGIGRLERHRPEDYVNDQEPLPYVTPDKLFELDILPDFYGKGVEGFRRRIYEEIRSLGIPGTVVFEFVVAVDGKTYDVEVIECSEWILGYEVIKIMGLDYVWTPGEISGFPVNVKLRMSLEFPPGY